MDAHDIFIKLTRGVHFNKKRKTTNEKIIGESNNKLLEKLEPIQIIKEECSDNNSGTICDSDNDNEIQSENGHSKKFFRIICDKTEEAYENEPTCKKPKSNINPEAKKKILEQEELNHFRNLNRISAHGKNIPPPIQTFDELAEKFNVPVKLLDNLGACGFPLPTPIQMQAIPIMLKGRSLMACAPTGSGKTIAFLTPIIRDLKGPQKKGFRAIILCPTRELAKQTQRECLRLTEKIAIKSHVISKIKQVEQKYGPNSKKNYDILVSTPNRVKFLLQQDSPLLDLSNIEWFIIDEADKLMEEGQNSFKEQFESILTACTNPNKKLALFSATYTAPVAKWASKNLKGLIKVTVGERNSATDLVNQELLFVGSESGKLLAIRDLVRNGLKPPVLVFVQSKERAKQLFDELIYDGINVDVIHADRTQQQRDNVVRAFREGKIWVLICTELMGRGIDFKGVNLVINYDFPPTTISYIHRIGRTGRAGRPGKAITFFTQNDTANLRSIAHIIKNSGGKVPEFMLSLKKPKKSEKKKLANFAPEREDITTIPKFILEKRKKMKEINEEKLSTEEKTIENKHNKVKFVKKNGKNVNKKICTINMIEKGGKVNRLKAKKKLRIDNK